MRLWGIVREISRVYGISVRNRIQSRKIQTILDMTSPKTVKEIQTLTRRIAALNRFVSKATDRCLPFFKTLKQVFAWTSACEEAFQELKCYLSNPPSSAHHKNVEICFYT